MEFPWSSLIPLALIVPFFLLGLAVFTVTSKMIRRGRRNPLTSDLLRNPGESLRLPVADLSLDIIGMGLGLMMTPFVFYTVIISQSYFEKKPPTLSSLVIMALYCMAITLYLIVNIIKLMRKRNRLRLGMECEMAVGQELNQLLLLGCRVYHDFPAENFNIDHIVIGPAGVYAVETKGRAKPDKGRGTEDAKVVYDGKVLRFPGWTETEPIAQAKRQAQWLTNWLKSAVGQSISVQPALALPGWFIDRQGRDMMVFNSKNPGFLATPRGERVLSDEMIQRIAHQVEQRCRTVGPLSYYKKKGQ